MSEIDSDVSFAPDGPPVATPDTAQPTAIHAKGAPAAGAWWCTGVSAALQAVERRDAGPLAHYLIDADCPHPSVLDAFRRAEGEDRLRRMLDLFGSKPLNASAYSDQKEVEAEFQEIYDLPFARGSLARLAMAGLGPQHGDPYDWMSDRFPEVPPPRDYLEDELMWRPLAPDQIHWLVIGAPGARLHWIVDQILAFGCGVMSVCEDMSNALRMAARGDYGAAYIELGDIDIEAAACVSDWFIQLGRPFIVSAAGRPLTPRIEQSGIVLRHGSSGDFAAAVTRCIPMPIRHRFQLDAVVPRAGAPVEEDARSNILFPRGP